MADSEGGGRLGDLGKRRSLEDLIKDMVEKDLGPQQEIGPAPWDQIVEPLNPEPAPEQTPATEEQTEPEPEPVQPVVQPVTPAEEPVAEEEQEEKPEVVPLVEPKTPKPTEEIREEAPETPADTYNEWMNYLQEQEALAQEEEQVSANNREPEPEEGYVQPGAGTQKVLGTYPAGTMDYLRENDLDLDWLNSEDGQYWLESRNQPQPEMLFPEDISTPKFGELYVPPVLPYADDIRDNVTEPARELGRDVSDFFLPWNNPYVPRYEPPVPTDETVVPNNAGPIRIIPNNAGPLPEIVELPPQGNGYVDTSYLRENPGLNSPVLSGNDPMAQFADLFETPPADQSQGLNTSPEYLAYLRDNPRLGASSYDEFADRMGNQNAAVPVPRTEPNTAAEDDWRTLIDQWENAEAANDEIFRDFGYRDFERDWPTTVPPAEQPLPVPPETESGYDWRTLIDQWENAEAANNELFRESLRNNNDGQVRDTVAKGAQSVINRRNADEEADAWVAAHRNPDTPWDQIDAEEDALYEQYYEGLENGTIQREQPLVTSNDVRDWMDQADADVTDWLNQAGSDIEDFLTPSEEAQAKYDEYEQATETVRDAGIQEGTPEFYSAVEDLLESEPPAPTGYEAYAERVADREYNPGSRDSSAYYASSRDNAIADVMNTGVNGSVAANIVDNPADYTYDETTGRWVRNNTTQTQRGPLSWEDAIGSERLMDDLMQMNAPGLMNEAGDFNTAAQALFMDELTPEQKLHLFDRNGSFFNEGSGVNVDMGDLYADLVANDTMHARRNPELSDTITVTPDQYETMINEFLDKNPLIKAMVDLGQVTLDQVAENFFKNVQVGQKKGGGTKYGSGYNRGGYGGGGYRGGYGGGRSYGGYQQNPTAANQTTQRINNIMKNWSF